MIWKFREFLANRALKKKLQLVRKGNLAEIRTAKIGCVLVNYSDFNSIDTQVIKNLWLGICPQLELKFITYVNSPKQAESLGEKEDWHIISKRDLSFSLEPKMDIPISFDVLIDFTTGYEIPLQNILLDSKAVSRMGNRKNWKEGILDFMIQGDNDEDFNYLSEQLIHYLEVINRNNAA